IIILFDNVACFYWQWNEPERNNWSLFFKPILKSPIKDQNLVLLLCPFIGSIMADAIELKTAPADFRFPTTNQTRHCFTRYIEFHRCLAAKGEESNQCEKFAKYYRSLCPGEWIDKWNEQRENGTFPGPL
ncbi:hypothetical protein J1N35_011481, partial [Gossypium stocksii]